MTYFLFFRNRSLHGSRRSYRASGRLDVFLGGKAVKAAPRRATLLIKGSNCSTVWWVLFAPVVVVGMGESRVKTNERYGNKSLFAHLVLCILFLSQLMVKQVIRGNAG
ncbi:hypothetical protein BGW80DRAFT_1392921 [Lactifluus volemus]|nr:hypothetical protein BGW80DRAFT_1392921 [Lactifluus volemus]